MTPVQKLGATICVLLGVFATMVVAQVLFGSCSYTKASLLPYAMHSLGAKVEIYRIDTGAYPACLDLLLAPAPSIDGTSNSPYARAAELRDPWRRPYFYRVDASGGSVLIFSLGADGQIGGNGENRDVQIVSSAADTSGRGGISSL